jgi:hypothetical protein
VLDELLKQLGHLDLTFELLLRLILGQTSIEITTGHVAFNGSFGRFLALGWLRIGGGGLRYDFGRSSDLGTDHRTSQES